MIKIQKFVKLSFTQKDRVFKCKVGETSLKSCILDDLSDEELEFFSPDSSNELNLTVINSLNSILLTCIGKDNLISNSVVSEAEILMHEENMNEWRINEIILQISLKQDNEPLLQKIQKCLKYCEVTCLSAKKIEINVNYMTHNPTLKDFKVELLNLKGELETLIGHEIDMDKKDF